MQVGTVNRLSTILAISIKWVYYSLIHTKSMSKDMSGREKLLFIASFMWAMHWGVRLTFAAFTTLELKFF